MRHAVINNKTKTVVNVIMYDGNLPWQAPIDCYIVQSDVADVGDFYNEQSKTFSKFYALN